jgi:type IV secretory pathway VirB2 component (pilin)
MIRAPSRTWNSTRVVEALITAGAAVFGLGLGVFLVTGRTMALLEGGIATLVLLLNEAVSRPLLRGLARRGSAVLAVVLGLLSQLVAITLVVALGIRASAGLSFGVGLSLPQAATILAIDAVVISGAQWLVSSNDAEYVLGYVSRRRRRRTTGAASGLVIVQLDGLGVQVFERALAAGQMPTVARWLHDGTHRLTPWWVPIPSTTPASQAAILFGDDTQIPSFRFWDRATGRLLVTNRPGTPK